MPRASSGTFFGMLTQSQKEQVLKDVAEEAAARFKLYMDTIDEATGLRKLHGQEARNAYQSRSPEAWAELQQRFPKQYERDLRDWAILEKAAEQRLDELYAPSEQKDSIKDLDIGRPAVKRAAMDVTPAFQPSGY